MKREGRNPPNELGVFAVIGSLPFLQTSSSFPTFDRCSTETSWTLTQPRVPIAPDGKDHVIAVERRRRLVFFRVQRPVDPVNERESHALSSRSPRLEHDSGHSPNRVSGASQ
jgi:hypothetical protein